MRLRWAKGISTFLRKDLRREATALKEVVADLTLENRLLKKKRDDKESYVFGLTRDGFDWKTIPLSGDAMMQRVGSKSPNALG
jgi:hypothetical protein